MVSCRVRTRHEEEEEDIVSDIDEGTTDEGAGNHVDEEREEGNDKEVPKYEEN